MSEKGTPRSSILNFLTLKRGRPSTSSSSEGTVSQVKKSVRITDSREEDLSIEALKMDLEAEFANAGETSGAGKDAVPGDFEKHMERCFQRFKEEIRQVCVDEIKKLKDKVDHLETRVKQLESQQPVKRNEYDKDYRKIRKSMNRQLQYSMKDNLRVFGLPETKNEDCKAKVCKLVEEKLKVTLVPKDISAAHRLPKPEKQKHKPTIVRFKDRGQRMEILKARKVLKASGISIQEDITKDNIKLMKDAEGSSCFESVWFYNGKIRAKDNKGTYYVLDLFDDFKKIVGSELEEEESY